MNKNEIFFLIKKLHSVGPLYGGDHWPPPGTPLGVFSMGQNNVWRMSVRLSVCPSVRLFHLISETVSAWEVPLGMHTLYGPGEVYKK